jgi:uncharacterized protein (DUF2249 family)
MEVDIRALPPAEKHRTIRLRLEELEPGSTLRIINDHDPQSLRYELEDAHPGCFTWAYVESGPQTWRVDILKTHRFEPFEDVDLLADSPEFRIARIRVPAGTTRDMMKCTSAMALIFDEGVGMLEVSGRRPRAIAAGTVEVLCFGETCALLASTELHAYVAITKQPISGKK